MNKKINELKNIHKGEDIWVIGAGSSMDYVDPSFFENKICISVNQMYEHFPCQYVVGRDLQVKERWDETLVDLKNHPTIKFLYSSLHQGHGVPNVVDDADNFYVFESGSHHDDDNIKIECIGTDKMVCIRTTLNTCIQIAAYMGAKNIMICGKDEGKIDGNLYHKGYVQPQWPDSENWDGIEHWLFLTSKNTKMVRDRVKEVYGCNIHSLNPFINFKLEGHKYEPTT
jgi:hypothetical protein|tara:strand:+ start:12528 stop:13208 length:681 start_codon:yes stop_codon:yes gene_type:complete